jgi:hypothetical protein
VIVNEYRLVLKCGFFHGLRNFLIEVAVHSRWVGKVSFGISIDFEWAHFEGRPEIRRSKGVEVRGNFVIDIFHTRILLFVYNRESFWLFKNWRKKKTKLFAKLRFKLP